MLNYIWLGLLILGIGAAISTDIVNQTNNKFKNGEPLQVTSILKNHIIKIKKKVLM